MDKGIVPCASENGCLGGDCCSAFCDLATVVSNLRSERFSGLFRCLYCAHNFYCGHLNRETHPSVQC